MAHCERATWQDQTPANASPASAWPDALVGQMDAVAAWAIDGWVSQCAGSAHSATSPAVGKGLGGYANHFVFLVFHLAQVNILHRIVEFTH